MRWFHSVLLAPSLVLAGCPADGRGVDAPASLDASGLDGGGDDGGRPDGFVRDVGAGVDATEPDAGEADVGALDVGAVEAGTADAGPTDAGIPDAGIPDAGAPDAPPPIACRNDRDCPDRLWFCQRTTGSCTGMGVCAVRPSTCSADPDPVCGCDRVSYANACLAAAAGVNVDVTGACDGTVACPLTAATGCCFDDLGCAGGERCVNAVCSVGGEGTCVRILGGSSCWEDGDCPERRACLEARICPCGATCAEADVPGRCRAPI
jgi:Kazal-type serine protease inhibitor domain